MSFDDKNKVTPLHLKLGDLPKKTKVLVLEDNAVDREALARTASKLDLKLNFHYVETIEALNKALERDEFDLAILDFDLPDGTGLEALRCVNQSVLNRGCATIMVAAQAEITIAVAAMKSGCSDYIVKDDLTPATLRRTIINALDKAMLRASVDEAGRKLVTLRAAVREHSEMSASYMRPLLKRSLVQLSALEFMSKQSGENSTDLRLGIIAENCRDMLKMCDSIERDGKLTDNQSFSSFT